MFRRGFTLIELMVASTMAMIVLGGVTTSLAQLGSAKSISRLRLEAFLRCDTALQTIRRDVITTLRRDDLFYTRILITDDTGRFQGQVVDRDELLVFNGNLRANKEIDFNGEGLEYETQFRLEDNEVSTALWKRRDAILDDNPIGGGMVLPISDGVISIQIEGFDGFSWSSQWDSDELGIPVAVRVTVIASGIQYYGEQNTPLITLRTVIPLDRIMPPADLFEPIEEDGGTGEDGEGEIGMGGDGTGDDGSDDSGSGGDSGSGSGGDSGSGSGQGRPGPGTGTDSDSGSSGGTKKPNTITDPDGNVHEIPG